MSKILILRPRIPDDQGNYAWHDRYVVENALRSIAKGKALLKMAPWISISGKISEAAETDHLGKITETIKNEDGTEITVRHNPVLKVQVTNQEADLFWRELEKLNWDDFGTQLICSRCQNKIVNVPDTGSLYNMLSDIAKCLEQKLPEGEKDEPDSGPSEEGE